MTDSQFKPLKGNGFDVLFGKSKTKPKGSFLQDNEQVRTLNGPSRLWTYSDTSPTNSEPPPRRDAVAA